MRPVVVLFACVTVICVVVGAARVAQAQAGPTETVIEDNNPRFPIRRGVFVTGDFGGYFSLGGRDNTPPSFSGRTVSNFQPAVGLVLGYDFEPSETVQFAVGLKLGIAFNAGSARLSEADVAELGPDEAQTRPADFTIAQTGLALKFGFFPWRRVAINLLGEGGAAFVAPDPFASATSAEGGRTNVGLFFGLGPGIEYFTLLPGFSIGLEARFTGTIASSEFIPGISITAPLKYNF